MLPKALPSRTIDSCAHQLLSWKPFSNSKTLDSDSYNSNPVTTTTSTNFQYPKQLCLSDRTTSAFPGSIDISKLTVVDDTIAPQPPTSGTYKREKFRWIDRRKRRRRGSGSLSGRSSDRSHGTRNSRCCCSVGATATPTATCSDFMVAATDSSGELFGNGNGNGGGDLTYWSSDMSEAKNTRREKLGERGNSGNGIVERETLGYGFGFGFDSYQWSESGYGSEPGYRGDAEFGYGDEFDEEEEDTRFFFWVGSTKDTDVEMVGENKTVEQKTHHRGHHKKHEWKMAVHYDDHVADRFIERMKHVFFAAHVLRFSL